MSDHEQSASAVGGAFRRFVGVPFRAQTYRNLAYLLLAFPLGIAYFTIVTVGLSMGLGMLVTLVGVPLVVVTLAVTLGIGSFEARLATWLLDMEVTAASPVELELDSVDGLVATTKRILTAPTTWTSLLLVGLKFIFGVLAFTAVVTAVSVTGALLLMPVFYDASGVAYTIGPYVVDTFGEALVGSALGLLAAVIGLHILNGLARLGGVLTDALVTVESEFTTAEPEV